MAEPLLEESVDAAPASTSSVNTESTAPASAKASPSRPATSATNAALWDALADMEEQSSLEQSASPRAATAAVKTASSGTDISVSALKSSLEEANKQQTASSRTGADALSLQSLKFGGTTRLRDVRPKSTSNFGGISAAFLKDLDETERFTFRSNAKRRHAGGKAKRSNPRGVNKRKKKGSARGAGYADKMAARMGVGNGGGGGRRQQRNRPF